MHLYYLPRKDQVMRKDAIIKIKSQFHEIVEEKRDAARFLAELRSAVGEDSPVFGEGFDEMMNGLFGEDGETMEICTEGELIAEDGRIQIKYSEPEPTGMGETTTAISFDEADRGLISIMRGGDIYTALILERGVRHSCVYNTSYIPITIHTTARRVENRITEDGGELLLAYTVEGGMGAIQYNKMLISVSIC